MIDLDDELAQEFLAECREHLDTMEADLLAMERREAEVDEELMNRVFRAVHSVKGGRGFSTWWRFASWPTTPKTPRR